MRIEYQKPWFLTPKLSKPQTNIIINNDYSISISFKVDKSHKKDTKIGFFGIPGKNYGISYDYEVNLFVFEFWTIINGENKMNCHVYNQITDEDLNRGLNVTITFDGNTYKIYKDFILLDIIKNSNPVVDDYTNQYMYLGCHNMESADPKHKCMTEMDIFHFSVYEKALDIKTIENLVTNFSYFKTSSENDLCYCYYDLSNVDNQEYLIHDIVKDTSYLKREINMSADGFKKVKNKLDSVGCGFCLAKWTQVTMHLHNGTTHSCHHPEPHKIGLEEVKNNPTALHNSEIKKLARKEMLSNQKPSECQYCWNVEDNSDAFSDRTFKSSEPWSEPYYNEIKNLNWRDNYNPKYVEVSFSNTCNFKCAYCGPEYSSKWMEEISEFGEYKLSFNYNGIQRLEERNTKPYKQTEHNPYVDAFWDWFPELYESLDTFRVTGGEPLLSKDTWKVLDYIIDTKTPNKNLKLSINSNLGVPDDLVNKLIDKLKIIIDDDRVKEMVIFTSCDGYGEQAEYSRFGLNFEKLFENIDRILTELPKVTIVVMSTFNIFSVFSYELLIKKIHSFKLKHYNKERFWNTALILDTSYLRHPPFLSFRILKDYITIEYFNRWINYMKFNSTYRSLNFHVTKKIEDVGFSTQEIEKLIRIRDIFITDFNTPKESFDKDKLDFYNFTIEYEIRRGLNCEVYFPELKNFLKSIKYANTL